MSKLVVHNRQIVFETTEDVFDTIDGRTAFPVKGAHFSEAYKGGFWDGREHLAKKVRGRPGWYQAPAGILDEVLAVGRARGVEWEVEDRRRRPGERVVHSVWSDEFQLRPYQVEAVEAATADHGLTTGRSLLEVPTRGGKTVIAARIIHDLGYRTLFIVSADLLLVQSVKLFEKALGIRVGRCGRGIWDPGPVTVATIQTLLARFETDECRELLSNADIAFFDECHHTQAEEWRSVFDAIDAFYKIGISATLFLHKKKESPKGTIWIRGATGPLRFKITPSELIEQGYLVPPQVTLYRHAAPMVFSSDWAETYKLGISENDTRNEAIVKIAKRRVDDGNAVVVIANKIPHVERLKTMLTDAGMRVGVIIGKTSSRERQRVVKLFSERKLDILLGTVFGEGVDIPVISAVIVAEGGKSEVATTQRFRCLTPAPGKDRAYLDDFADQHHRTLAQHSLERLAVYKSHGAFRLSVEDI